MVTNWTPNYSIVTCSSYQP